MTRRTMTTDIAHWFYPPGLVGQINYSTTFRAAALKNGAFQVADIFLRLTLLSRTPAHNIIEL